MFFGLNCPPNNSQSNNLEIKNNPDIHLDSFQLNSIGYDCLDLLVIDDLVIADIYTGVSYILDSWAFNILVLGVLPASIILLIGILVNKAVKKRKLGKKMKLMDDNT